MSFEITGRLVAKYDTVQRTETFKTREFVIEKTEEFNGRTINNYIKFQCVQDRTTMPDRFNIGDEVKVSFNIKGTKWMKDGRENYITNLDAWRMENIKLAQENYQPSNVASANSAYNDVVDDLPF
jgi:nitrous oxidase accessory protein NosD